MPDNAAASRLGFLDALRGIAAAWVVMYHVTAIPKPILAVPQWASWISAGASGVVLFFVVSAFSLCYTTRFHGPGAVPFYIRRFFRIAPLFYAMLVFSAWPNPVIDGTAHSWPEIALNVVFAYNFFPSQQWGLVLASWTIGVEMIFYLVFPLVLRQASDIWRALALALAALLLGRAILAVLPYLVTDVQSYWTLTVFRHLPVFLLGVVAYLLRLMLIERRNASRIGVVLTLGAVVVFGAIVDYRTALLDPYYWQAIAFSMLLVGLSLYAVPLLVNRLTTFLGRISYSLYLLHSPLVMFLRPAYRAVYEWTLPNTPKLLICLALTFALVVPLAYCTYRFIERPGIRLGNRLIERLALKGALGNARAAPS